MLTHSQLSLIADIHSENQEFGVAFPVSADRVADANALCSLGYLHEHVAGLDRSVGFSVTIAGLDAYNLAIRALNAAGAYRAL